MTAAALTHIYTVDEVADRLHKTRRWLMDWLRIHTHDQRGNPLFKLAGRSKVITDEHIQRIIEALPCPSSSFPP